MRRPFRFASPVTRTTLSLLPLQVVARTADASLPVIVALWFGRSPATDAYYFAWALFGLVGSLVFSAFHDSAVVPILVEVKLHAPASLPSVRGSLLVHTLAAAIAAAGAVAAVAWIWLASRYTGEVRTVALRLVAPFSLYLVALCARTLLASWLHAEHHYRPLPVASAAGAVVAVAVIGALRRPLYVAAIPCGSLAGECVIVAWLAASARSAGMRLSPTIARPEPVRRVARLVAAEVGGGAVTRVNPLVDQLMAGLAGVAGGGTMLKLTGDVAMVPTSLLQAAMLPVLLTHLSDASAAGKLPQIRASVRRALAAVIVIMAVAGALLWAVRRPLLRLVFAHGAMDPAGVERMARILPYHLVGLAPFGALLVLARAHVAVQNSRVMVSMGIINAALNALLDVALVRPLGLEGLALATSCTSALVALVFFVRLGPRMTAASGDRARLELSP